MFFKIAGSPYDGSKKALPTAKLKLCIIKAQSNKSDILTKFLFEIPLLFRHDRTSLMRAKSASVCCAGAPGAEHLLLPWGYSCGRGNP